MYDYFYGAQSDQFSFIRIPTVLFSEERFKALSAEAKVLYGILLKRMDLSARNGWFDKQGRVYIICTLEEIMETLNCADKKATRLMNELETKCGLIERKRQGLGRPNLIYVKNFITRQNNDSRIVKTTIVSYEMARVITSTDKETLAFYLRGQKLTSEMQEKINKLRGHRGLEPLHTDATN